MRQSRDLDQNMKRTERHEPRETCDVAKTEKAETPDYGLNWGRTELTTHANLHSDHDATVHPLALWKGGVSSAE